MPVFTEGTNLNLLGYLTTQLRLRLQEEGKSFREREDIIEHFHQTWASAHPRLSSFVGGSANHNPYYLALPGHYTPAEMEVLDHFFEYGTVGDSQLPPYPTPEDLNPKPSGPTLWEHLEEVV